MSTEFSQSPASKRCRGFLHCAAMNSTALESHYYGDPAKWLEAKQARESRQKKRVIEGDDCRNWSPARKAAEALFDIPPDRKP
jgi:hypothetical protein